MTKTEYKVGDEVLVRAKIGMFHETDRNTYQVEMNNWGVVYIKSEDIYSLAPPFNIGEEIEVSDYENITQWDPRKFLAYCPNLPRPYLCVVRNYQGIDNYEVSLLWKYARKIQPKESQVIDKTEEDITVIRDGKKHKLVEIE